MMNELALLTLALAAGVALGACFFGGLWWTVEKGINSDLAAFWFLGSTFLRMSLALSGFYFVAGSDWRNLLACLLGFILGRMAITRLTRVSDASPKGAHAP